MASTSCSLTMQGEHVECADVQDISAKNPNYQSPIPRCTLLGTTDGRIDEHHAKQQRREPDKSIGHN